MNIKQDKGRKPSYMQTQAVVFLARDWRRSKAKALRMAGYSKAVIRNPKKVFGSPVVRELMRNAGIQEGVTFPKIKTEEEMRGGIDQDANMTVVNVAEERMKFAIRVVQMSAEERRVMVAALDAELERRERIEKENDTLRFANAKKEVIYPTEVPYSYRYNAGSDSHSF